MHPISIQSPEVIPFASTVAEINLTNLKHNAIALQKAAGGASLMAVVKADAYGHGAPRVAAALVEVGVRHFAVANVAEGIQLRECGIEGEILVFGVPFPECLHTYAEYDLDVTVSSAAVAEAVIREAKNGAGFNVHVKVDTGMSRLGVSPDEAPEVVRRLDAAPGVTLRGIWTHFANADEEDDTFSAEQLGAFRRALAGIGRRDIPVHAANSAAILTVPESFADFERALVRPGLALYGVHSLPTLADQIRLKPVMRLVSRVCHVKTVEPGTTVSYGRTWTAQRRTRIATVAAGYADGYPRLLSNRGFVGIRNRRYPVAGVVCMDMLMVDLGDPDGVGAEVQTGDRAVLFGDGGPTVDEVADLAQTIPYEVLCGVSARVPRVYTESAEPI